MPARPAPGSRFRRIAPSWGKQAYGVAALCAGLAGCRTTAIDVLERANPLPETEDSGEPDAQGGLTPGSAQASAASPTTSATSAPPAPQDGGAGDCAVEGVVVAAVHRLFLRANGGCLRATSEQVPLGVQAHGYTLTLTVPCVEDESTEFQLAAMLNGSFQISTTFLTSLAVPDQVLDVMMGEDSPGTPVILYSANGLLNQQFRFSPRDVGFYGVSPGHASFLCVDYSNDTLSVQVCDPTSYTQQWQLLPLGCSPSQN
jgi:hypothetical protein